MVHVFRWMGRKDIWIRGFGPNTGGLAAKLPAGAVAQALATGDPAGHSYRADQPILRLTEEKASNWLAALEVTEALKGCDPMDPVRYDFALCRLGILDLCQRKYRSISVNNANFFRPVDLRREQLEDPKLMNSSHRCLDVALALLCRLELDLDGSHEHRRCRGGGG